MAVLWGVKKSEENEGAGDTIYHYETCSCGYQVVDFHRFGRLPLSSRQHRKICLECGYEEPEDHVQKPGTTYCALCGQVDCEFIILNTGEKVVETK